MMLVDMPRYVSREALNRPGGQDFNQTSEGATEVERIVIVQGLLVAPERRQAVTIPKGTPGEPRLMQKRQSRITAALTESDPKFSYRPAKSDHPDVGVRLDRENAAASLAGRGLDSRPTLVTARRRKTTAPLSGLSSLEPTHRLVDLNVPFETVAVALMPAPSGFKLSTLTTGGGGLSSPELRRHYQDLLAQRIAAKTDALAAKAEPSGDLSPEIPW